MNAEAVLVNTMRRALTLSTRTRVTVSLVTWQRTARQVNVDKDGPGTHVIVICVVTLHVPNTRCGQSRSAGTRYDTVFS